MIFLAAVDFSVHHWASNSWSERLPLPCALCGAWGTKEFFSVFLFHPLLSAGPTSLRHSGCLSLCLFSFPSGRLLFLVVILCCYSFGTVVSWFSCSSLNIRQDLCTFSSGWNFLSTPMAALPFYRARASG